MEKMDDLKLVDLYSLPRETAFADDEDTIVVPPNANSLEFLQAIYRSPNQPMARRLKAASIAIQYESPKLAVTAVLDSSDSFAVQLQAAIDRSNKVLELRAAERAIEHAAPLAAHAVHDSAAEVSAVASARTGMVSYRRR
jgi:hypothetical protein